ncbi:MAG: hypothetical protein EON93_00430 [Burkholderiales bacterium]|nr:MAG: hypothetical protein EON93_00430 [Burkholderiales bacterium]
MNGEKRLAVRRVMPRNIGRAVVLALAALPFAYFAGIAAFAEIARHINPVMVAKLVPSDPMASAMAAWRRIETDATGQSSVALREIASRGLRQQAVNNPALHLLMIASGLENRPVAAATFARLSEKLTRHDLTTQLWLIDESVRRDDHHAALLHYDRALKTTVSVQPALFQVLLKAISDPQIRAAMVPLIQNDSRWVVSFLLESSSSDPTAEDTARLLLAASPRLSARTNEMIAPQLLTRLTKLGKFDLAFRYAQTLKGARAEMGRNAGFDSTTIDPRFGALSWVPAQDARVGASFETRGSVSQARVFASANSKGIALHRVLHLTPGVYGMTERRKVEMADPASQAHWEMRCGGGAEAPIVWRIRTTPRAYRVLNAVGLVVPTDCLYQTLDLVVDSGEGQQGLEFVVEELRFLR